MHQHKSNKKYSYKNAKKIADFTDKHLNNTNWFHRKHDT